MAAGGSSFGEPLPKRNVADTRNPGRRHSVLQHVFGNGEQAANNNAGDAI
jgi:hypothetical protein